MKLCIAACVLVTNAVLVSGCVQKYAVTGSGPTAKLRFTTNTGDLTLLDRYDIGACPGTPQPQRVASTMDGNILVPGEVSPIHMIGTSGAAETKIRELLIEASKPFVFKITASRTPTAYSGGYTCTVSGGFTPRAGGEYEISFQSEQGGCRNHIFRLSRGGDGQAARTSEPTQRYIRTHDDQDFCQWWASQDAMPVEIMEALERPESSRSSTPAPADAASDGKSAAPATEEPGSEIRDALKKPQ